MIRSDCASQLEYYISVLCPQGFTSRGIYGVYFDNTVKVYANSLFSPLYLIGILSEILLDPEATLSFYLPVIYLLLMWMCGLLFYTMNYNPLSIFILIFTLSQIWPVGTSEVESATSLIGHWCYIQEKTESSEPFKISKATIVLTKNLLLIKEFGN